ncbi:MAG: FUSC family protein [Acidimicrobiales bacterium]
MAGPLKAVMREAARVDRSKLSAAAGLRAALGMVIPLVVGGATGHLLLGVTASIGALTGGFASLQGTYRSRVGVMLAASGGFALSAFVGGTAGHLVGPDIALVAAWGLAAGILVALGPAAAIVGLQSVVGLIVFGQFAFGVAEAATQAGLVLSGGVLQAFLVVVVWPLRRFPAERRALGAEYDRMSGYARSIASSPARPARTEIPGDVAMALRDPQPFGPQAEMVAYRELVDHADRIRLELAALARARQRLWGAGAEAEARALDTVTLVAADALQGVADSLRRARAPEGLGSPGADLVAAARLPLGGSQAAGEREEASNPWQRALLGDARDSSRALLGQLRAVIRLACVAAGSDPGGREQPSLTGGEDGKPGAGGHLGPSVAALTDGLGVLRANLTLASQPFRHALRLAVALAVATGVSHLFPFGHGYWLALTVMIVLRPDFAATFTRGLSRSIGTLVGVGLVTVVLATLRPGSGALIGLTVAFYWGAITVLLANYAAFSVCIASLVVTLLAFTGAPEVALAADRSIYTVVGALLALLAYAAWPTWERTVVPDRLAVLAETEGRYGSAVLVAWADPEHADQAALHRSRLAARLARSNARASVDRWLGEPTSSSTISTDVASGVLAAVGRYVWGALALHARLPPRGPSRPQLLLLADQIEDAMRAIAEALRSGKARGELPRLRAIQLEIAAGLDVRAGSLEGPPEQLPVPGSEVVVLVSETDLLVDAVDTLGHLVGLRHGPERERAG